MKAVTQDASSLAANAAACGVAIDPGTCALIDQVNNAPGVWRAQRRDIARHWLKAVPPE